MRYLKYCPSLFYGSPNWTNLLEFAMNGIGIEHSFAAKTLYMFIDNQIVSYGIMKGQSNPFTASVYNMLIKIGEPLLKKLLVEIVRFPPRDVLKKLKCVIMSLLKALPGECAKWSEASVGVLPSEVFTQEEKIKMVKIFEDGNEVEENKILDKLIFRCKNLANSGNKAE